MPGHIENKFCVFRITRDNVVHYPDVDLGQFPHGGFCSVSSDQRGHCQYPDFPEYCDIRRLKDLCDRDWAKSYGSREYSPK